MRLGELSQYLGTFVICSSLIQSRDYRLIIPDVAGAVNKVNTYSSTFRIPDLLPPSLADSAVIYTPNPSIGRSSFRFALPCVRGFIAVPLPWRLSPP